MIKLSSRGSFKNIDAFLLRMRRREQFRQLSRFGEAGVSALATATPKETGNTADSWYYQIVDKPGYFAIHWLNSNVEEPGQIPIAAVIQYGHATRNGGYVQGVDYINPAMRPIFEEIAADMWKEVTK